MKYFLIKMTKDDRSWLLYRDGKFSAYKSETEADQERINLEFSSEFVADFELCQMSIDDIKDAVGVPYDVYNIRAGLVKLEGVLVK